MKVLLTGANGFVGSHILDALRARQMPAAVLVRPTSQLDSIRSHLSEVEVRHGAVTDAASLRQALSDITHVIHCAGITKALRVADFRTVNRGGTANLVDAINARGGQIQRLIHVSSLAAAGPATPSAPARETDPPRPVSAYGQSKLEAELEVASRCLAAHVILRPPGVYGPRDVEFLRLFRSAQRGWVPVVAGGTQPLSLVFAPDLAAAVLACLEHPRAVGKTFAVAGAEVVTTSQLTAAITRALGRPARRLPVPGWAVRVACLGSGLAARFAGRASVLAHDKHREVLARGWVCDVGRLRGEVGFECPTPLAGGLAATLAWYRASGWLGAA